ncbi:MAG: hypothetical protein WCJ95_20240 [Mariniphaga sp.]
MELNPELLHRSNTDKYHFVGMGSCGSNLSKHLYLMGAQAQFTVIINSERTHHASFRTIHYTLPECGHYKHKNWSSKKLRLTKKITSLFNENLAYIFVLGLGGTGTVLLYSLIPWLLEKKIDFKIICSFPSLWEGKRRVNTAGVLFSKMNGQPFFDCFRLDDLIKISGDTTVKETLQKSDEHFYTLLTNLIIQRN